MKSASCAALLLAAAALAACESSTESAETATAAGEGHDSEQEDDSDTAPFMIVVEHMGGRRCGGSLVSLRTALTSAWCAGSDGGGEPRELWALAPGAGAARRVARVALAAGADAARTAQAWGGAAVDLAVLELEAPFGGGARSRPILMATQPAECAAGATCHVVRALGGGRTPRLRIVDAALVAGEQCAARSPGWPGLRDTALCLVGPTLCSSDWGAGVVCEGKLCGVLSRSARAAAAGAGDAGDSCGDTHVAQSIPRWRSGGDCGQLCSERRLLGADGDSWTPQMSAPSSSERDDTTDTTDTPEPPEPPERTDSADTVESSAHTEAPPEQHTAATSVLPTTHALTMPRPVRLSSATPPTRSAAPAQEPLTSPPGSPRTAFEFEPNRPDFKAGEYGDNAADYGGEDAMAPTSPKPPESSAPPADSSAAPGSSSPYPPAPPSASPVPTRRAGPMAARVRPVSARSRAARPPAHAAYLLYVLVAITNLAN